MYITRDKIRRYRFNKFEIEKLELLKKYSINEAKFVRKAIDEKMERDFPKVKEFKEMFKL